MTTIINLRIAMQTVSLAFAFVISLAFSPTLSAQTLTEKLVAEPPEKLLLDARERGNIVRGAILFHQGNIACAKCHRPVEDVDRIGPNLGRLPDSTTDASIIESLLQPSKVIAKDYQAHIVLDVDDKSWNGVIVEQDDKRIVLRDSKDITKLVTIERQDVETITESSLSIMPNGLVDQLKDRQQFLDLLLYVLDLKARGADANMASSSSLARRELSREIAGLVALRKYNCGSCHAGQQSVGQVPANAPNLKWSAEHLNPEYLAKFISDPSAVKPGTNMPHVMLGWDADERTAAAEAIVCYLKSLVSDKLAASEDLSVDATSLVKGQALYHEVGCVACHAPRDAVGAEIPLENSAPLGDLADKYSFPALVSFLKDPHAARPHGRMPNMRLTHREAIDVAAYLMQKGDQEPVAESASVGLDAGRIAAGRILFQTLNCNQCHDVGDAFPPQNAPALADLRPGMGCLAESTSGNSDGSDARKHPHFELTAAERSDLQAALEVDVTALNQHEQIELSLSYFNCTACHSRDQLGGVTTARRPHFQTTNLNLGEQGRIPPALTGVGAKLKRKWMRDVLVNGRSVRPYMKTRMPQYGEANVGHLVDLFQSTDKLEPIEFATVTDEKAVRTQGLELVGNKGLNCVACHTYQFKISDTMPAVDLTEMAERLHKDWFTQYMLAPQKFVPNTVMPSFWPNGKAIRPDLAGTPKDQVEALWQYLLDGRQARTPRGVIRKPLEIAVQGEARMLRRSYPGMGKRGIGVGYPGGINLAFDAEQLRLASLWKGRFVDPAGVWYGQGHGRVRPLGNTLNLNAGPELDDASQPWMVDDGRPPEHRFLGYRLDEKRRPTFRYVFREIEVEDYFVEQRIHSPAAQTLRRQIQFDAPTPTSSIAFRLLSGEDVEVDVGGKRVTDGQLSITVLSDHVAKTRAVGEPSSETVAVIPLDLQTGVTELVLEYSWE